METTVTKILLSTCILFTVLFSTPRAHADETPTKEIVENAMRPAWEKKTDPRTVLTINSIKFATSHKATMGETQVEGIPQGAMVTPAMVDFTVRAYYNDLTESVQRVREIRIFKDKFDEWKILIEGKKGEDKRTEGPPQR